MKTGIYYFSATGNSLTTAKLLAASLDGQCDVISLAALHNKQDIEVDYERVGFVFPIYYGDMPYLIRDTIRKMKFKQNTYIFIFTTYRGHPGDVAKRFDNLLQEKNLSLALSKGNSLSIHICYSKSRSRVSFCFGNMREGEKMYDAYSDGSK